MEAHMPVGEEGTLGESRLEREREAAPLMGDMASASMVDEMQRSCPPLRTAGPLGVIGVGFAFMLVALVSLPNIISTTGHGNGAGAEGETQPYDLATTAAGLTFQV
jgi:hypothetical protein